MRAVVIDAVRGRPEVCEVAEPTAPDGGVVVRVMATGLCRSDWHGWMGHDADIPALPHVPGHELVGVVEAVGADVRNWRPGDRVTTPFVCACGVCAECAGGHQQVCERQVQPGFTTWGSFAQYVAVEAADVNLVAVPAAIEDGAAAGLGCRFATAYRAVLQVGGVRAGETVAVHGCGGVGLSAVMVAAAAGARVVAVDVSSEALALARACGATDTVDARAQPDTAAAIRELTGGGAHLSLDALGSHATCVASVESLRTRGRHVQVGLLPPALGRPAVPMELVVARELQLRGSHGMAAHAYPAMLALVEAGRLRPGALVTRRIGLEAAGAALAAMSGGTVPGVTVIDVL